MSATDATMRRRFGIVVRPTHGHNTHGSRVAMIDNGYRGGLYGYAAFAGPHGRRVTRAVELWLRGFSSNCEEEPATPYFAPKGCKGRNGRFKRKYLRAWLDGVCEWVRTFNATEAPICEECGGSGWKPIARSFKTNGKPWVEGETCVACDGTGDPNDAGGTRA